MTPDEIKTLRERAKRSIRDYCGSDRIATANELLALCDAWGKSEAACAAMREAITPLVKFWDESSAWLKERFEADVDADAMQERVHASLSSTAGQQMLDRIKELEANNASLKDSIAKGYAASNEVYDHLREGYDSLLAENAKLRAWVGQAVAAMELAADCIGDISLKEPIAACLAEAEKLSCQ